jgi:hypothetical protein
MAICLFTACVTGFVLWAVQPKRRVMGLVGLGVTAGVCVAVWIWLVP